MKGLTLISLIPLIAAFLVPANARADGTFVAPEFVWDKHKDINEPTQKAIIVYDAGREDLVLQVKYTGPVRDFGWLIPVPNLPTVRRGSMKCFYELSQTTQPQFGSPLQMGSSGLHWGWGLQAAAAAAAPLPPPVKVIETKTAGAYKFAVLSANDSGALQKWLADNHFYFPPEKADVTDSYIKKHWYFIAVKIRLGGRLLGFMSTSARLASGELNPLQISFASDRCVFPLKISSVNGKPSEVEVYVLSPEPLVEKGMLEKKLSEANGSDARPDGLYMHLDGDDLPDCTQWIPRLADKSWWLLMQTWTFKAEEMRDLQFDPALHVFTDMLGTRYGHFAATSLLQFGQDADSTIIAAMQSTNPAVRIAAAGVFNGGRWGYGLGPYDPDRDRMFADAALNWLNDPEPAVRRAGIELLTSSPTMEVEQAKLIVDKLGDENAEVRQAAVDGLKQFSGMTNHFMPAFTRMLASNSRAQASVLHLLRSQQVTLPREVLTSLLRSRDSETLDAAWTQLQVQGEKLSDDDASALLENPLPAARCLGLSVLGENPGKQSVELAMSSYLHDPNQFVRVRASQTLQGLTGQHFTQDQPNEWTLWWDANKDNF